jgi:hypothetical protein
MDRRYGLGQSGVSRKIRRAPKSNGFQNHDYQVKDEAFSPFSSDHLPFPTFGGSTNIQYSGMSPSIDSSSNYGSAFQDPTNRVLVQSYLHKRARQESAGQPDLKRSCRRLEGNSARALNNQPRSDAQDMSSETERPIYKSNFARRKAKTAGISQRANHQQQSESKVVDLDPPYSLSTQIPAASWSSIFDRSIIDGQIHHGNAPSIGSKYPENHLTSFGNRSNYKAQVRYSCADGPNLSSNNFQAGHQHIKAPYGRKSPACKVEFMAYDNSDEEPEPTTSAKFKGHLTQKYVQKVSASTNSLYNHQQAPLSTSELNKRDNGHHNTDSSRRSKIDDWMSSVVPNSPHPEIEHGDENVIDISSTPDSSPKFTNHFASFISANNQTSTRSKRNDMSNIALNRRMQSNLLRTSGKTRLNTHTHNNGIKNDQHALSKSAAAVPHFDSSISIFGPTQVKAKSSPMLTGKAPPQTAQFAQRLNRKNHQIAEKPTSREQNAKYASDTVQNVNSMVTHKSLGRKKTIKPILPRHQAIGRASESRKVPDQRKDVELMNENSVINQAVTGNHVLLRATSLFPSAKASDSRKDIQAIELRIGSGLQSKITDEGTRAKSPNLSNHLADPVLSSPELMKRKAVEKKGTADAIFKAKEILPEHITPTEKSEAFATKANFQLQNEVLPNQQPATFESVKISHEITAPSTIYNPLASLFEDTKPKTKLISIEEVAALASSQKPPPRISGATAKGKKKVDERLVSQGMNSNNKKAGKTESLQVAKSNDKKDGQIQSQQKNLEGAQATRKAEKAKESKAKRDQQAADALESKFRQNAPPGVIYDEDTVKKHVEEKMRKREVSHPDFETELILTSPVESEQGPSYKTN